MYDIRKNITIKQPKGYKLPKLKPLCQVYRDSEYGVPVTLFPDITGLKSDELYRKLIPMKYLTVVKVKKRSYILKDFYWLCLLEYLQSIGRTVIKPTYVKLEHSKTL